MREYNLFISHAWTYDQDYNNLIDKLNQAPYFYFKNYSVPKTNPLNANTDLGLTRELYGQIRPCSIVIVIAGMYVKYRKWIQKEIDIAKELKKPILVIRPFGAEKIPLELYDYAMVYWNTSSIVDAIKKYSL
jgi:hypothetical protein